jgi:hypothetical protein
MTSGRASSLSVTWRVNLIQMLISPFASASAEGQPGVWEVYDLMRVRSTRNTFAVMRIAGAWRLTTPHCVGSCRKPLKSSPHIAEARFINIYLVGSVPCGIPSVATKAFGRLPLSATSRLVDLGRKIYALSSTLLLYWVEPDGCHFFFSQVRKVQVNQSTSCRKCKPSKSVLPWAHRLKHGG